MTDPRSTPAGLMELLWLFFHPGGRISRHVYWLAFAAVLCVIFALGRAWEATLIIDMNSDGAIDQVSMTDASAGVLVAMLPLEWCALVLIAKRCRDHGWSGLVALIWMVPLANILLALYMGLVPGDPGANRYGPGPDRP
ncbi:uncharacterized membrane protein YhaH (DUF805 family) [Breoghania corrubedonensis]|uniref:Uncharacterized membrane protein YhaH (DUF805 family) n=1 Tax=Breoghania corrubedonensis TaxID=665038 RepID=A0A2T5VFZ7_9HYPH|nr:DUF805 domain-containing protein [Breoghania corrubedonensis]PTW62677.1 uncharacterized membrane protein YhaH (DUF805 family) [Breoghania corrubedonensis]